jgi:hypothetical protein
LPRISANVAKKHAPPNVTRPAGSSARGRAARDSGSARSVATVKSAPSGRLTRNTHRQPGPSTSAPPASGPAASAAPVIAPQTPSANGRSGPWNSCASSASDAANIAAAPMPCAPRATSSATPDCAAPHAADVTVKRTSPAA